MIGNNLGCVLCQHKTQFTKDATGVQLYTKLQVIFIVTYCGFTKETL